MLLVDEICQEHMIRFPPPASLQWCASGLIPTLIDQAGERRSSWRLVCPSVQPCWATSGRMKKPPLK